MIPLTAHYHYPPQQYMNGLPISVPTTDDYLFKEYINDDPLLVDLYDPNPKPCGLDCIELTYDRTLALLVDEALLGNTAAVSNLVNSVDPFGELSGELENASEVYSSSNSSL